MAVIDWFSRYVLSWELSVTMDTEFCVSAVAEALAIGERAEIFNTDQGSQFTSETFTGPLLALGVSISMDGRGRALDNVFIERLWRSVKYEEVYLKAYEDVGRSRRSLGAYFRFYKPSARTIARLPHAGAGVSGGGVRAVGGPTGRAAAKTSSWEAPGSTRGDWVGYGYPRNLSDLAAAPRAQPARAAIRTTVAYGSSVPIAVWKEPCPSHRQSPAWRGRSRQQTDKPAQ